MSTPFPFDFPISITAEGLQPQSPASLLEQLSAAAITASPGITNNLPGILIEDVTSTEVAGIALIDAAKVEAVNSLTPYASNNALLIQLGNQTGMQLGAVTNTSVPVVFTSPNIGYVITQGFLVSDGTNSYACSSGGVINASGFCDLTAVSVVQGSTFAVPQDTVTTTQTSVPSDIALSVNNPSTGTPGGPAETYFSFRARVLQAGLAASVGTARYIKTLLTQVSGVTSSDVSVVGASPGIRVICSGGDPYQIAYAIFCSVADVGILVGSAVSTARNVTVTLFDFPNTYQVTYVNTQTQTVALAITWNTTATNFTGGGAFQGLVQAPLAAYINALAPGQGINILEMNEIFQVAVQGVLDPSLLTRLVFSVSINNVATAPATGSSAVFGDPESNFNAPLTGIVVTQG